MLDYICQVAIHTKLILMLLRVCWMCTLNRQLFSNMHHFNLKVDNMSMLCLQLVSAAHNWKKESVTAGLTLAIYRFK